MTRDGDTALEVRLHALLAELRPTDGASAGLRARVLAIPDVSPRVSRFGSLRTLGALAAAAAVLTAVIITLASTTLILPRSPAGAPAPTAGPFDPLLEGPGIIRSIVPTLTLVPIGLAVLVAVLGLRWVLRRGLGMLYWRAFIVVAAALMVGAVALQPGFGRGSSYGPEIGYDLQVDGPPGSDTPATWYETAEPGGPLMLTFTLVNPGPLPIRLEGLIETQTAETPLIQRWTALWLGDDPNAFGSSLEHLVPFTPQTVAPMEELQVYLVGRAGMCAYGPGYTVETPVEGHSSRGRTLTFAYSALGLQSTAPMELRMQLVEPYRLGCP